MFYKSDFLNATSPPPKYPTMTSEIYKRIMPLSSGFHLPNSLIFHRIEDASMKHMKEKKKISPECTISMSNLPHPSFSLPESFFPPRFTFFTAGRGVSM